VRAGRKLVVVGVALAVGAAVAVPSRRVARADQTAARHHCPAGFLYVPSGTFTMGSPPGEGDPDEHPAHTLTLPGFCMERLEVTVADYQRCVAAGACTASGTEQSCNASVPGRARHPINCVDWNQATAYCRFAGARLPSEEEWEYAARGSDGRKYPWGNKPPNRHLLDACDEECVRYAAGVHHETKVAMYPGSDGYAETAPVGSYPYGASPFGILDMAGNVYEWTSSPYCNYPRHACASRYRVYRGGGWYTEKTAAVATRNGNLTTDRSVVVGIRCAK
jgi:formylglycine-generating enzyme required for sulfatase activity